MRADVHYGKDASLSAEKLAEKVAVLKSAEGVTTASLTWFDLMLRATFTFVSFSVQRVG